MKHFNHRIITTGAIVIAGVDLSGVASAMVGSTLPDLDLRLGIPHRTLTHWWILYAGLAAVSEVLPLPSVPPLANHVVYWLCIGALFHILEDSVTPSGVPLLLPFGKNFSFNLSRTGGKLEYVLSGITVFGLIILAMTHPPEVVSSYHALLEKIRHLFVKTGVA